MDCFEKTRLGHRNYWCLIGCPRFCHTQTHHSLLSLRCSQPLFYAVNIMLCLLCVQFTRQHGFMRFSFRSDGSTLGCHRFVLAHPNLDVLQATQPTGQQQRNACKIMGCNSNVTIRKKEVDCIPGAASSHSAADAVSQQLHKY